MPNDKSSCSCNDETKLIFPCSGAADVGELSDQAARSLSARGDGKMFCLAAIGGNIENMIVSTKRADRILVIDGCNLDCAKKTLEEKGISNYDHLRVTDLGMEKSKSSVTEERINLIVEAANKLINAN